MDYKSGFTNGVQERKLQSASDANLADKISGGKARASKYGENWQEVDIDDIVKRFAPGSEPVHKDGKMYYCSDSGSVAVVADIGGGYLRIQDLTATTRSRQYLDLNGNDAHNYTDSNGKQHGRNRSQYNAATHFKIKKRKPRS